MCRSPTRQRADFHRYVDRSVLPLMLRDAKAADLTICFVRVQRRPIGGKPPAQSRPCAGTCAICSCTSNHTAAYCHDDTGDPAMTLDMYEDGDHIARQWHAHYTDSLLRPLRPLFQ